MGVPLIVEGMGLAGVNVDKNPLELDDDELTQATNAVTISDSGRSSLRKRPGLIAFSLTATPGTVLGGASLPFANILNGTHFFYIGRGPTT